MTEKTYEIVERAESVTGIPMVQMTEELEENIRHRGKTYMSFKNSIHSKVDDDDSDGDIMGESSGERSRSLYCRSSECELVNLEDFQLVSILGKGSFGKVYLVYLPSNGAYYAMKSIRKDIVLDNDSIENIKLEKLILLQVNNPFIVSMQYVFQRSYRIYFIMEFVPGSDLFQYLREERRFSERRVKFYAAQIAIALGYLHKS